MLYDLANSEELEVHDVKPDGNCMFRAVIDQLRMLGDFTLTAHQIRQMAVQFLRENPLQEDGTHFEDFFVATEESWNEYLKRMTKDGEWGDQIMLGGLAAVLQKEICIISVIGDLHNQTTVTPRGADKSKHSKQIYLGHVNDQHYCSLRPKGWQNKWYKEMVKPPCEKPLSSNDDNAKLPKDMRKQNIASKFIDCSRHYYDEYSGVSVLHLSLLIKIVLPEDNMLTPNHWFFAGKAGWPKYDLSYDLVGSVIEDLAVNLHESFIPERAMCSESFHAKKVTRYPNLFKPTADENLVFKSDFGNVNKSCIIINQENAQPGYGYLEILKENSGRLCRKMNGSYLLMSSVYSPIRSGRNLWDFVDGKSYISPFQKEHSELTVYFKCPRWPEDACKWISRNRPSGWPSKELIKGAMAVPCVLTSAYPYLSKSDIDWVFNFSFVEKFLLKENITKEQRYCFHVFKVLVDFHTGRTKVLSTFILKTIFLYALEVVPLWQWESCSASCVMYMIDVLLQRLREKQLPHYFITKNNIIANLEEETIYQLIETVNVVREFPIVSVIIMAESHGLKTTYFTDQVLVDLNLRCLDDSTFKDSILNSVIPKYTEMAVRYLNLALFRESVSAITSGYDMMKELNMPGEKSYSTYQDMSLFLFISEATKGMKIFQVWWLCFFVDLFKKETTLSNFSAVNQSRNISDMMEDCSPGDLDNVLVPNYILACYQHGHDSKCIRDVGFLSTLCTYLTYEEEYEKAVHYTRGLVRMITRFVNNPDAIMAKILQNSDHNFIHAERLDYAVEACVTAMYNELFSLMSKLFTCYVHLGKTEYFQEYIDQYESVCYTLSSSSAFYSLANAWKSLGNKDKMSEALQKQHTLSS